jgi:hypothetical protein
MHRGADCNENASAAANRESEVQFTELARISVDKAGRGGKN